MLSSGLSWLFGFAGVGKFGTVFLYCLAAFVFVCKCYPRGCRGFLWPVLGFILDDVLSYLIASRIPPGQGRKHSTASWTQRVRRSELDVALPGGILGPSGYLLGPLGGFWEAIPRLRLTFAFDALLGAVVAFWLSFGVAFGTDFFYYLVAWLFVCKCSPRGCRGFPGSVWRLRLSI